MIGPLAYERCASCGHLGATHPNHGGCVAQVVTGIAAGRRPRQCPCRVFIPAPDCEFVTPGGKTIIIDWKESS